MHRRGWLGPRGPATEHGTAPQQWASSETAEREHMTCVLEESVLNNASVGVGEGRPGQGVGVWGPEPRNSSASEQNGQSQRGPGSRCWASWGSAR